MVVSMVRASTGQDSYQDVDDEGISKAENFCIHIKNLFLIFDSEVARSFARYFTDHHRKEEKLSQQLSDSPRTRLSLSRERIDEVTLYFDAWPEEQGCVDGHSLGLAGPATFGVMARLIDEQKQ